MASDETMMTTDSSFEDEDFEDGFDHHHLLHRAHPHNLSRLSVCTSSSVCGVEDDVLASMCMSHLSIESFDGEFSERGENELSGSCYSLPRQQRNKTQTLPSSIRMKDYASENEARNRRMRRDRWGGFEKENSWGNGEGVMMVITRPKGGKRSLCMDLEEVKACRDLGFELEHERMLLEIPSPPSAATANSPIIANWRISAPGDDDPRDVKARLKVWAQAVALASASSKYGS